jgi:hypothetical protein
VIRFLLTLVPLTIGLLTLVVKGVLSIHGAGFWLLVGVLLAETPLAPQPRFFALLTTGLALYVFSISQGTGAAIQLATLLLVLYGFFVMIRGPFAR